MKLKLCENCKNAGWSPYECRREPEERNSYTGELLKSYPNREANRSGNCEFYIRDRKWWELW